MSSGSCLVDHALGSSCDHRVRVISYIHDSQEPQVKGLPQPQIVDEIKNLETCFGDISATIGGVLICLDHFYYSYYKY